MNSLKVRDNEVFGRGGAVGGASLVLHSSLLIASARITSRAAGNTEMFLFTLPCYYKRSESITRLPLHFCQ